MFAYIKGKLTYKYNDYVVIETGGVGYMIFTALSTLQSIGNIGDEVTMFTYMHVREDAMSLYGFATHDELSMFEFLISVSGVGPKVAISLISAVSPSKFGLAVITDDIKTLTQAPGIGKKIAQRIILELKDKIKKEKFAQGGGIEIDGVPEADGQNSKISEAISALMVLGYTSAEASRAVSGVYAEDMDIESIVRNSLKEMTKR